MPISSWIVSYESPSACRAARDALSGDPRLVVGEPTRHRLPVATETDSVAEEAAVYALLRNDSSAVTVELVFADASDVDPGHRPTSLESRIDRRTKQ